MICGETHNCVDFGFGFVVHLDYDASYIINVTLRHKPLLSGSRVPFSLCVFGM